MPFKFGRWFPISAGILLTLTAAAKVVSAFGSAHILQRHDPVLPFPYRWVFVTAAMVELGVAGICFSKKPLQFQAGAIAWLGSLFLIYRLGLAWGNYPAPCKCLGNLTDALGISPESAATTAKIILIYLLLGSYGALFWIWRAKHPKVG